MSEPQYPPQKITKQVLAFCERLVPGTSPLYVPVRPFQSAKYLECFQNVLDKIQAAGGTSVLGWEISEVEGIYLEAQFHAVWRGQDGSLVDVTPEEYRQDRILFLEDPHRTHIGTRVPNERFSQGNRELVQRLLDLADLSASKLRGLAMMGVERGDPRYEQELAPLLRQQEHLKRLIRSEGPTRRCTE